VEGDGGLEPGTLNDRLPQGPLHAPYGLLPAGGPGDDLGDQAVVVRGDLVAGVEVAVHPDAGPPGKEQGLHLADGGPEALLRVLGVDAHLYSVAPDLNLLLLEPEPLPHGDPKLGLDQVHPRHHLRDGVLHLDAGVHLNEVEVALLVHQKLQGPRRRRSPRAPRASWPPRRWPAGSPGAGCWGPPLKASGGGAGWSSPAPRGGPPAPRPPEPGSLCAWAPQCTSPGRRRGCRRRPGPPPGPAGRPFPGPPRCGPPASPAPRPRPRP
jgi:hypothetical protein